VGLGWVGLGWVALWLSCLHCCLTARRSWVRFPHGALLALGLSPGPFCVEFASLSPCSQGVSFTKNPNRKTCKKNRTLLFVPETEGSIGPRSQERLSPLLLTAGERVSCDLSRVTRLV